MMMSTLMVVSVEEVETQASQQVPAECPSEEDQPATFTSSEVEMGFQSYYQVMVTTTVLDFASRDALGLFVGGVVCFTNSLVLT